jgi:hypothetical protein
MGAFHSDPELVKEPLPRGVPRRSCRGVADLLPDPIAPIDGEEFPPPNNALPPDKLDPGAEPAPEIPFEIEVGPEVKGDVLLRPFAPLVAARPVWGKYKLDDGGELERPDGSDKSPLLPPLLPNSGALLKVGGEKGAKPNEVG